MVGAAAGAAGTQVDEAYLCVIAVAALVCHSHCADAAQEAGFADQAHLTRVFKERFGITPSAYRKAVS